MKTRRNDRLGEHLGFWLRYVSNHVSQAFAEKLDTLGVTVAEWVILRELYERDAPAPSELADHLGLTRGAISKLVDRLVAKALVSKVAGRDDRRSHTLSLTRAGKALVPKLKALADKNDAEFFNQLLPSERASLERILRDVVAKHALHAVPIE